MSYSKSTKFKVGDFIIHTKDGVDNNTYICKITKVFKSTCHRGSFQYNADFFREILIEHDEWIKHSTGKHNFEEKSNFCDYCKKIKDKGELFFWLL